ncbi:MAG: 50S ribosomal protein L4 [Chloroflexota bacterium]|nr:50S ribosomal protein L4 [Chloroflexota bacterium]
MEATVYNLAGEQVRTVQLDEAIFGVKPNIAVIHQAVLRQQANARQGTANTLTRAHVRGGGRKPWRQKGTGRARQGSTRSPQWAHGGVVFGPHTRSYEQDMPRKMRRLAIRGVLSAKAADGQLVLIESFAGLEPRTKAMIAVMKSLNVFDKKALIMTTPGEEILEKAAGNLPHVKMMSVNTLSIVDILKHDVLVLPMASLDVIRAILGTSGGRVSRTLVKTSSSYVNASAVTAAPTRIVASTASTETTTAAETTVETVTATTTTSTSRRASKANASVLVPMSESATRETVDPAEFTPVANAHDVAEMVSASPSETAAMTEDAVMHMQAPEGGSIESNGEVNQLTEAELEGTGEDKAEEGK